VRETRSAQADALLMDRVESRLERAVPAAMEPLTQLEESQ
jgi:hypothetical protein